MCWQRHIASLASKPQPDCKSCFKPIWIFILPGRTQNNRSSWRARYEQRGRLRLQRPRGSRVRWTSSRYPSAFVLRPSALRSNQRPQRHRPRATRAGCQLQAAQHQADLLAFHTRSASAARETCRHRVGSNGELVQVDDSPEGEPAAVQQRRLSAEVLAASVEAESYVHRRTILCGWRRLVEHDSISARAVHESFRHCRTGRCLPRRFGVVASSCRKRRWSTEDGPVRHRFLWRHQMWRRVRISRNLHKSLGIFELDIGQYAIKSNPHAGIKSSFDFGSGENLHGFRHIYWWNPHRYEPSPSFDLPEKLISPLFAVERIPFSKRSYISRVSHKSTKVSHWYSAKLIRIINSIKWRPVGFDYSRIPWELNKDVRLACGGSPREEATAFGAGIKIIIQQHSRSGNVVIWFFFLARGLSILNKRLVTPPPPPPVAPVFDLLPLISVYFSRSQNQ